MTQVWSSTQINAHLSGGGTTTATQGAAGIVSTAFGSEGFTTGKFFWITKVTGADATQLGYGLGNTSTSIADGQYLGIGFDTVGVFGGKASPQVLLNGGVLTIPFTIASGDYVGHALDVGGKLYWFEDITTASGWYGWDSVSSSVIAGSPSAGTNGINLAFGSMTVTAHPVVPGVELFSTGDTGVGYFAAGSWNGISTPPSGFGPFDPCPAGSLALSGVGCSIGWRASLLAAAAWRASEAIEKNDIMARRRLLGGKIRI